MRRYRVGGRGGAVLMKFMNWGTVANFRLFFVLSTWINGFDPI
jgi:hypothetical protein